MSLTDADKKTRAEVLLVGNDPEVIHGLHSMLQGEEYTLHVALDREQAWQIVYQRQPMVAILTGPDALSLCRKVRNNSATEGHTHLIVISSGYKLAEIFQAGADDVMINAVDVAELCGRVAVGVRIQSMRRQLTAVREDLERMALSDGLTGIYNHRYLRLRLDQEVAMSHRHDNPLALIMLDVDAFKMYNDTFGHEAGNQALMWLAQYITRHVRAVDVVARYGGEEFCVILPMTHSGAVIQIAERLCKGIEADSSKAELASAFTVSIGCARLAIGEASDELVQRVDHALYVAKRAGRNQCIMAETYGEQTGVDPSNRRSDSYTIMVVEDDSVLNRLLVKRLEKVGHQVLSAANGAEAMKLFQKYHPEVVVTDWMMPQMDGLELCRQLRRTVGPYAYILLLTAKDTDEDKLEGFHSGVDDYLTKPFNEREMLARVEVGLRLVRALRKALSANERLSRALQQNQKLESENLRLAHTEAMPEFARDISREIGITLRLIQKGAEEIAGTAAEKTCQHDNIAKNILGWTQRCVEACQYLHEKHAHTERHREPVSKDG